MSQEAAEGAAERESPAAGAAGEAARAEGSRSGEAASAEAAPADTVRRGMHGMSASSSVQSDGFRGGEINGETRAGNDGRGGDEGEFAQHVIHPS
jgi:hypothetical protein